MQPQHHSAGAVMLGRLLPLAQLSLCDAALPLAQHLTSCDRH
jgi:hypothetical protein